MTRFLLIRHGMTDAVGAVAWGTAPGLHLNDRGRAEIARLAELMKDVELTAVVSSPLERARETAAPLAAARNIEVEVMDAFTEFRIGGWTGRAFADLDQEPEWRRFNTFRSFSRPPAGELMLDVQQRAVSALFTLRDRYPRGSVAIVSHGDVIRAMLVFALGMPIDLFHRVEVSPARVSIVDLHDETAIVRQVNADTALPDV
jgi:broad specificity phosphatase PhoE